MPKWHNLKFPINGARLVEKYNVLRSIIGCDRNMQEQSPDPSELGGLPSNMPWESDVFEPYPTVIGSNDISLESPNINAITKEQAIEIARTAIARDGVEVTKYEDTRSGAIHTIQTDFRDARYVDSADPIGDPSWFVVFSELTGIERYVQIPDNTTPEEFLAANNQEDFYEDETYYRKSWIGTLEEDGETVLEEGEPVFVMATAWVRYIVVEVNALTGDFIERGVLDISGFDLAFDAFYGDIREFFLPWPMD